MMCEPVAYAVKAPNREQYDNPWQYITDDENDAIDMAESYKEHLDIECEVIKLYQGG